MGSEEGKIYAMCIIQLMIILLANVNYLSLEELILYFALLSMNLIASNPKNAPSFKKKQKK